MNPETGELANLLAIPMGFFWLFVFSQGYRERVLRFNDTLGAWRWVVIPIQAFGGVFFGVIVPLAVLLYLL